MPDNASKPRVLVCGIERLGLQPPTPSLNSSLFELEFEPLQTPKNFRDYSGVILFQSTFETIERIQSQFDDYWKITYDRSELLRRQNQLNQLLDGDGFVCFLLHRDFIDRSEHADYSSTDLSKIYLHPDMYKEPFKRDVMITKVYRSEFQTFLNDYGSARTGFRCSSRLEPFVKKVCDSRYRNLSGFILFDNRYYIPCRLPAVGEVQDFFVKIGTALVATSKKLQQDVPEWVQEFRLPPEDELLQTEAVLSQQLQEIQTKKDTLKGYKRCLCYDGELLVDSVSEVLRAIGFRLSEKEDENIEDKVILDDESQDLVLLEIKGMNDNAKSTHVYQADSHRGRREKPDDFPSVLIVNTFIRSSNTLLDKLRDIEAEQAKLASKKRVLVMRTIDLLNLLALNQKGELDKEKILQIFKNEAGWLKVREDGYEVVRE